jgi:hypothetical protein
MNRNEYPGFIRDLLRTTNDKEEDKFIKWFLSGNKKVWTPFLNDLNSALPSSIINSLIKKFDNTKTVINVIGKRFVDKVVDRYHYEYRDNMDEFVRKARTMTKKES